MQTRALWGRWGGGVRTPARGRRPPYLRSRPPHLVLQALPLPQKLHQLLGGGLAVLVQLLQPAETRTAESGTGGGGGGVREGGDRGLRRLRLREAPAGSAGPRAARPGLAAGTGHRIKRERGSRAVATELSLRKGPDRLDRRRKTARLTSPASKMGASTPHVHRRRRWHRPGWARGRGAAETLN